eukprot:Hpha_TRINITY_DN30745_c0_g1::TRINITY_DN30745_c0_g1_i1::g.28465::m.28465/K15551/tauA; taurine transport system substrate-binding protein
MHITVLLYALSVAEVEVVVGTFMPLLGTQYCMQRDAFTKFAPPGYRVRYWDLNSGGQAIKHMRDGTLPVSVIGSSPTSFAIAMGMDVASFGLANIIGASEGLYTKSTIKHPTDLVGTVIATPLGSTAHFHLLELLKAFKVLDDVTIVGAGTQEAMRLYDEGEVDGIFAWDPAISHVLSKGGKRFADSALLGSWGVPTFNG